MKVVLGLLLVLLISCNKEEKKPFVPLVQADLGTYEVCESEDGVSAKSQVFFNENSIVGSLTLYSTTDCTPGDELFNERDYYSYINSLTSYTLRLESIVMTSLDATVTSNFNSASICQYTNWSTTVPKQITGRDCEGTTFNVGDESSVSIFKSGTSLVMSDEGLRTTYGLVNTLDLSPAGQTVANGTYIYYDGTRGAHLTLSSPNFQLIQYNESTRQYYTKNGTYTSANNELQLTAVTNTPDCAADEGSAIPRMFTSSTISLGLDGLEGTDWLMEKVSVSSNTFRDVFLGTGYVAQCF